MEFKQLGDILPDDGLAVVAAFKAELENGDFTDLDYLNVHKRLRNRLMSYKHHLELHGVYDIDFFVLITLRAIGVLVPSAKHV